jgi:hypothetical protein
LVENGFRFKPNNPGSYLVFPWSKLNIN